MFVRPGGAGADPIAGLIDRHASLFEFRDRAETLFITRKLEESDWNVSQTAEAIGVQRSHLYTKMKEYGIERPE